MNYLALSPVLTFHTDSQCLGWTEEIICLALRHMYRWHIGSEILQLESEDPMLCPSLANSQKSVTYLSER